jgi:predicted transcriptional regulator
MYIYILLHTSTEKGTAMEQTDTILKIVGNETRRRILSLLSEEPHYISEIAKKLQVTQPAILKHLSILENANLIENFWKDSPVGAARKYYRICDSVGLEIAINPKTFKVNKQPQETTCPKFSEIERTIRQLTSSINEAKDLSAKAERARKLIRTADTLLACIDFRKDKWVCGNCRQVTSLRKETAQIILNVASGDVEAGLRKLMDAVDQITSGVG